MQLAIAVEIRTEMFHILCTAPRKLQNQNLILGATK